MDENAKDRALIERQSKIAKLIKTVGPEVLGNRLRRIRNLQGVSIREVATQAGISKNSIVRLEQGRGTQAMTVLRICTVLGIHIEKLAEASGEELTTGVAHRAQDDAWYDMTDFGAGPLSGEARPMSDQERRELAKKGVVPLSILKSRLPNGRVLPTIVEVYGPSPTRSHVGEEFAYVLEGEALISVGQDEFLLKQGESVTFWSAEQHTYAPAPGSTLPARILSVRVDG